LHSKKRHSGSQNYTRSNFITLQAGFYYDVLFTGAELYPSRDPTKLVLMDVAYNSDF